VPCLLTQNLYSLIVFELLFNLFVPTSQYIGDLQTRPSCSRIYFSAVYQLLNLELYSDVKLTTAMFVCKLRNGPKV